MTEQWILLQSSIMNKTKKLRRLDSSYVHQEIFKRIVPGGYGGFCYQRGKKSWTKYIFLFNKTSSLALHKE